MSTGTKIFKGPSSIQIPRLTADPSGTTVSGEIYYNTTSNKFRQYVNGAWANVVDETSVASFSANKTLSNLTNPTALNEDILGSADNVRSLGASATRFANVFSAIGTINSVRVKDTGSAFYNAFVSPSMGANVTYTLPATDGTTGQQLTTNGSGALSWAASGGGANTALSNLITTAINQDLLSAADNTLALGAVANRWSNVFSAIATTNALRVKDSGSAFYSSFAAPSMGANVSYTLPATDGSSGQVLSTNGSGVLTWASGGSGANVTLSNLTSPTAINQDLIFNKATPILQSKDQTAAATNSENLLVKSGNSDDGSTGELRLGSGEVTAASGNSGEVYLESGLSSGTGSTGNVFVRSNAPTAAGGGSGAITVFSGNIPTGNTNSSGNLDFHTGTVDTNPSGSINIYSGDGAAAGSGNISLYSGLSSSGSGNSGGVNLYSGTINGGGQSGNVNLYSGDALDASGTSGGAGLYTGASIDGASGNLTMTTGAASGAGGTGSISIATGNAAGAGNAGTISIGVGTSASGFYGNINIQGRYIQSMNQQDGYLSIGAPVFLGNGQNTLQKVRLEEKTLTALTVVPTVISGYLWPDNNYASAKLEYQMTEVSTGKVRRGTLYMVQDYNTAADVVYNDTVEVENASFPNVALSVVSTGGNVEIQYTNASTNNVFFAALSQLEPNAFGTI